MAGVGVARPGSTTAHLRHAPHETSWGGSGGWVRVASPVTETLRGVSAHSEEEAWAVGESGALLEFRDGEWSLHSRLTGVSFAGVSLHQDRGTGLAVGNTTADGAPRGIRLTKTATGWTGPHAVLDPDFRIWLNAVSTVAGSWVVGGGASASASESGYAIIGEQCSRSEGDYAECVYGRAFGGGTEAAVRALDIGENGEIWAVGDAGTVLRFRDGVQLGPRTVPPPRGFANDLLGVAASRPGEMWAVGTGGSVVHYARDTWRPSRAPSLRTDLAAIDMIDGENGWAVGNDGTFVRYENGRWRLDPQPVINEDLVALDLADADSGWAVGRNGAIVKFCAERNCVRSALLPYAAARGSADVR